MRTLLFFLLSLLNGLLFAQTADSLFIKANKLYQQEKYTEAIKTYEQIAENQIVSEDLYYNMGNTYYKMNQVAPAVYYYEKALLLNPGHSDALHNLSFAKRMAIDNIEALPKTIGERFSQAVIQRLHYNSWAWLAVIFALGFTTLFLLYHFAQQSSRKRIFFISSLLSAMFVILFVLFAFNNSNYVNTNRYAIVFEQQVDVKSAPTVSGELSFELHEGAKVKLLETVDDWFKIKLADGKIGWMPKEALKEIK